MIVRHLFVAALSLMLTYLFFLSRSEWHPMHAWNRAFADSSLTLLFITLVIGPLSRIIKPVMKVVTWRRELGIWTAVTALVHIYIVMDGWVMWDLIMLFKVPFYDQLVIHPGFALGNLIGIVALVYLVLLALISNQKSVRYLGSSAWNYLQQKSLILYVLVVLHTVYFIFFHMPDRTNWLQQPLLIAVTILFVFHWLIFFITARKNKKAGSSK
jgi:sulfoxide reductase heme-binding subunit YedZ